MTRKEILLHPSFKLKMLTTPK